MGILNYLVHYEPNGFIRNCVYEPGRDYIEMCEQRSLVYAVVEGSPPDRIHDEYYVSGGVVIPRPVIASLSDLPVPCTVTIDGEPVAVDDGSLEIEGGAPGVYKIEIDHWPYLPFEMEVVVE